MDNVYESGEIDSTKARAKADALRKEAQDILNRSIHHDILENIVNNSLNRFVDCVIHAAVLESAILMNVALQDLIRDLHAR
jgi:hypothetical protein